MRADILGEKPAAGARLPGRRGRAGRLASAALFVLLSTGGAFLAAAESSVLRAADPAEDAAQSGPACTAGPLACGPHDVGFTSVWVLDHGRTYSTSYDGGRTYGADKAPRPVLVNLWYPARARRPAARMAYGEYFRPPPVPTGLASLTAALGAHARAVAVQEIFETTEADATPEQRQAIQRLLATKTAAYRDAPPAPGRAPLVVYHSGAGSSYEDNSQLLEYLASHGFAVIGSAFLERDGSSLGVEGGRGSAEDIQVLLRHAGTLDHLDWRRVGFVGHSLGAQAVLAAAAQPGAVADAVVLLDSTLDYYTRTIPSFSRLGQEIAAGAAHLSQPLLVAAGPEASFELLDDLTGSDRTYLTLPALNHNEFISQGLQRLDVGKGEPTTAGVSAAEVRSEFVALSEMVRLFLEAALLDQSRRWEEQLSVYRRTILGKAVHVERALRDTSAPPAFSPEASPVPTPRQLLVLFDQLEVEPLCAILRRAHAADEKAPIFDSAMLSGSLVFELHRKGRIEEARALDACYEGLGVRVRSLFRFLARMSSLGGRPAQAASFLRVALALDPADTEARELLDELTTDGGASRP